MLPTFLVIGAMKAGTTSLHAYLAAHPEVFMATPKELRFFVAGKNWERGLGWYEEHFADARDARARGEISPDYTKADVFPGVPERIATVLPDVRLVYVVRDPIERMRSMYTHEVSSGRELRSIDRALREDPHYLNTSRYAWQLDRYRPHVGDDRMLVITSEALRDERVVTLERVYEFVGVDPSFVPPDASVERGRGEDRRAVRPGLRQIRNRAPVRALVGALPRGARRRLAGVTRSGIDPSETAITPELEAELHDALVADVHRLRDAYLGPEFDAWGLA